MILTGLSGFGASYGLLHLGMEAMWQRYPLAVVVAYLSFLVLLRIWVELERLTFNPEDPEMLEALKEGAEGRPVLREKKKDSWLDWLDVPNFTSVDAEGCVIGILVAAVLGVIALLVTVVAGAPLLLAEVAMDVFLVSILYRRLKAAEREHWLAAAVRQTWLHVLATATLLAIVGACLDFLAPGANTIGQAVRQWIQG